MENPSSHADELPPASDPEADIPPASGLPDAVRAVSSDRPLDSERRVRLLVLSVLAWPSVGAAFATLVTFVVFTFWAADFLTVDATQSYLTIAAELGVVALGVTMLMIAGEFDLSVGSVLGLSALLVPLLMQHHVPATFAILIGLLAAAAIGCVNGLLVTFTVAPSLIVTLGAMMFYRGVVFALTGGFPVEVNQSEPVFQIFSYQWNGYNVSIAWMFGLAIVLSIVLLRTPFGNWVFATGGAPESARKTGIPTRRVKIVLFALTAVLAALAGMIEMTRFASVDALRGQGTELTAIAAAVVGGTSLRGGSGTLIGTLFGVITFGMIQVGLQLATVPGYWYDAFVGLVLILAVLVHQYSGILLKRFMR